MALPGDIREIVREELFITRPAVQASYDLLYGTNKLKLSNLFIMVLWWKDGPIEGYSAQVVNPEEYWSNEGLKVPANKAMTLMTRVLVRYPIVQFHMKMPTDRRIVICVGGRRFELASWTALEWWHDEERLFVVTSRMEFASQSSREITAFAKPTDITTAKHTYTFKVNKGFTEVWIDDRLRAIALHLLPKVTNPPPFHIDGPPYTIIPSFTPATVGGANLYIFPSSAESLIDLTPHDVSLFESDPNPPKVYPLYETGTDNPFAGKEIESGELVSHPVPVLGYENKTIYFMADKDSTSGGLVIEVLTQAGNWRVYDSLTYTANKLLVYKMTGDAILVRVRYTPASYPAKVLEGEVVMV